MSSLDNRHGGARQAPEACRPPVPVGADHRHPDRRDRARPGPARLRAAGEWAPEVEGRGGRGRRPRSAFQLEVPPIPEGMAAASIDDPDVVAEKLLEADLQFLDAHATLPPGFWA